MKTQRNDNYHNSGDEQQNRNNYRQITFTDNYKDHNDNCNQTINHTCNHHYLCCFRVYFRHKVLILSHNGLTSKSVQKQKASEFAPNAFWKIFFDLKIHSELSISNSGFSITPKILSNGSKTVATKISPPTFRGSECVFAPFSRRR